jgi:hypothetical protein
VPTVLLVSTVVFAVGTVGVVGAVNAQRGASRDESSKEALAAAESGVSQALLHYNRIVNTSAQPCVAGNPAGLAARTVPSDPQSWCPAVGPFSQPGVPGAEFTYWVKPTATQAGAPPDVIQIVSRGEVDGTARTIEVMARSSAGMQPFSGSAGVVGLDFLTLNSNAEITGDVGTNGSITMNSNAVINCDYAHIGVGRVVLENGNADFNCPTPEQGTISLPPVNQGDVPTNNSNARIGNEDSFSSSPSYTWNPGSRELTLNSNTTLTLSGSNYSFCRLILNSNSAIYIAAGSTVRMYFDRPEACGYSSNTTQLALNSNSRISVTGGTPSQVALLFVGSNTIRTNAILNSNTQVGNACDQDFVIYAPRTDITFNSNSHFCGAIAGRSIMLNSNSDIGQSNQASDFILPNTVAHHYVVEKFVECGSAPTDPPDAGC